jgi:hypothetical protein
MALDATVGGAQANSYATRAEATAYFTDRHGASEWGASSDDTLKDQCLMSATWRLDQEVARGQKSTTAQRLAWPRSYVEDPDVPVGGTSVYLDGATLPRRLKEATYELALVLFRTSGDYFKSKPLADFSQLSVAGVFLQPSPNATPSGALPDTVARLLDGLVRWSSGSVRLVRG